jgi:hypothetical protein
MNLFNQIIEKSESLLPENITWNEINKYNHLYEFDLKKPIFIAFFLYVMRLLFERLFVKFCKIIIKINNNYFY